MIDSNIINKTEEIIKFYKLNTTELRDIAFSIIMSDYLSSSNKQQLDIDKFVVSCPALNNLLQISGTNLQCSPLPDVQVLRIICDTLIIAIRKQGVVLEDVSLTSEVTNKVCNIFNINMNRTDYADENECIKVLNTIWESCASNSINISYYNTLEQTILKVSKFLLSNLNASVNLVNEMKEHFEKEGVCVPCKSVLAKEVNSKVFLDKYKSCDAFNEYITDCVIFKLELIILTKLKVIFDNNMTFGNNMLNRLRRALGDKTFGTKSSKDLTSRIGVVSGFPSLARNKLANMFREEQSFNKDDMPYLFMCIAIMRAKNIVGNEVLEPINKIIEEVTIHED